MAVGIFQVNGGCTVIFQVEEFTIEYRGHFVQMAPIMRYGSMGK